MDTSEVTEGAGLHTLNGETVTVVGAYSVTDTSPRKVMVTLPDGTTKQTTKVVHLVLSDDARVRIWTRPDAEMHACNGKRVAVTGRIYFQGVAPDCIPAPTVLPSLVDIQGVELRT